MWEQFSWVVQAQNFCEVVVKELAGATVTQSLLDYLSEPPGEFLKILMLRLHPKPIRIPGLAPGHQHF